MNFVLAALLAFATVGQAFGQAPTRADDERAIGAVIDAFRAGVIAKDEAALARLPVSPGITFASATTPDTLARIRARHPEAKRLTPDTYPGFVQFVVSSKDQLEETVADISTQNDGTIATVYFTYQFLKNGKVSNKGHESWGLISTDQGWKISSIIWSVEAP